MKAVVCTHFGGPDEVELVEQPSPVTATNRVVVELRAAAVNFTDPLIVQGKHQLRPSLPFVPGTIAAGIVRERGAGVTNVAPGDRVVGLGLGAYAELVSLPAAGVAHVPDAVPLEIAASVAQSYSTAVFALEDRGQLRPGEWVLVLGAGGNLGRATIDYATALGANVIAAASSDTKLERARQAGARFTINYQTGDLKTEARELSGGGVDIVIDPVGGNRSEPAFRALKSGGRLLVLGFASGQIPVLPLNLPLLMNRSIVGVDMSGPRPEEKARTYERILSMITDGTLHPRAPICYSLVDTGRVLAIIDAGHAVEPHVLVP